MQHGAAAPALLRRLNAATVLGELRTAGALRVTQLVERTGLSRPTVESIADDLVSLGWVSESLIEPGQRRGRPARELSFNAGGGVVLGIDIGVRRTTVVVSDLAGEVRGEVTRELAPDMIAGARIARVADMARETIRTAGFPPHALMHAVAGSPGVLDVEKATVTQCAIMPGWSGLPLGRELRRELGCTVDIENDANLAAAGERWRGVARGIHDLVFVLAGERLGAGIVVDGRTVRGHAGGAGEMGFTHLFDTGSGSEGIGALGRLTGGEALHRLLVDGAAAAAGQPLRSLSGDDPSQVSMELLLEATRLGDTVARDVLESINARIARAIAVLAIVLDPEMIVVGGAVADAAEEILEPLRTRIAGITLLPARIEASTLSHRAVALGAVHAALASAWEELALRAAPLKRS